MVKQQQTNDHIKKAIDATNLSQEAAKGFEHWGVTHSSGDVTAQF
jgi:hypothetical protein